MFQLLPDIPTDNTLPPIFEKMFGKIHYNTQLFSYQQNNSTYLTFQGLCNKVIIFVENRSINETIFALKNKFFIEPILILHELTGANVMKLYKAIQQNHVTLKHVGFWSMDDITMGFLASHLPSFISGKIVISPWSEKANRLYQSQLAFSSTQIILDEHVTENAVPFIFNSLGGSLPTLFGASRGNNHYLKQAVPPIVDSRKRNREQFEDDIPKYCEDSDVSSDPFGINEELDLENFGELPPLFDGELLRLEDSNESPEPFSSPEPCGVGLGLENLVPTFF